jgi:hypothetical protein
MDEHATAGSDTPDKPTEIKPPATGSSMQAAQRAAKEVCALLGSVEQRRYRQLRHGAGDYPVQAARSHT